MRPRLKSSDTVIGDDFGASVGISGTTVIVGAPGHGGAGSAYVFSESGSTWSQVAEQIGALAGAEFGASAALSGTAAVAGAPLYSRKAATDDAPLTRS